MSKEDKFSKAVQEDAEDFAKGIIKSMALLNAHAFGATRRIRLDVSSDHVDEVLDVNYKDVFGETLEYALKNNRGHGHIPLIRDAGEAYRETLKAKCGQVITFSNKW